MNIIIVILEIIFGMIIYFFVMFLLKGFTREQLKSGLAQLPESNQRLFKQMYSHNNMELPIDKVVDNMLEDKLDWAMEQVQKTLNKRANN